MYDTIEELPFPVRRSFTPEDQAKWMEAYNKKITELRAEGEEIPEGYFSKEALAREFAWDSCKYLPSSRYVDATVSTEIVDVQRELLEFKSLMASAKKFVDDNGIGHIDHNSRPFIHYWMAYEGKCEQSGKPTLNMKMNFARGTPLSDKAWLDFLNGKDKWSVGFGTDRSHITCESGKGCYKVLNTSELFEVSNTQRGANPLTSTREYNNVKSETSRINDMNVRECPSKLRYDVLKEEFQNKGFDADITSPASNILLVTSKSDVFDEVSVTVKEVYGHTGKISDKIALIPDYDDELGRLVLISEHYDGILSALATAMLSETRAIKEYNDILLMLNNSPDYHNREQMMKIISELRDDEEKHIGALMYTIGLQNDFRESKFTEGADEGKKASEKSICPAGHHEHPGIEGCHLVARDHHEDKRVTPHGQLVLQGENIDLSNIQDADTPQLKRVVRAVASAIAGYTEDEINEFLTSTPGKELLLIFLELRKRKKEEKERKENGKMEIENKSQTPTQDAVQPDAGVKGEPSLAEVLTGLASSNAQIVAHLQAQTELLNSILNKQVQASGGNEPISNAISDAVSGLEKEESTNSASDTPPAEEVTKEPENGEEKETEKSDPEDSKPDVPAPEEEEDGKTKSVTQIPISNALTEPNVDQSEMAEVVELPVDTRPLQVDVKTPQTVTGGLEDAQSPTADAVQSAADSATEFPNKGSALGDPANLPAEVPLGPAVVESPGDAEAQDMKDPSATQEGPMDIRGNVKHETGGVAVPPVNMHPGFTYEIGPGGAPESLVALKSMPWNQAEPTFIPEHGVLNGDIGMETDVGGYRAKVRQILQGRVGTTSQEATPNTLGGLKTPTGTVVAGVAYTPTPVGAGWDPAMNSRSQPQDFAKKTYETLGSVDAQTPLAQFKQMRR